MSEGRKRDELLSAHLDGTLDAEGTEQLLALLRSDPEALRELAGLQDVDVLLSALGRNDDDRRRTADLVMGSIRDTGRRERLADAVVRDLGPTRRATRSSGGAEVAWAVGLAAAMVLVVLMIFTSVRDAKPLPLTGAHTEQRNEEERLRELDRKKKSFLSGPASPDSLDPEAKEEMKRAMEERRRLIEEELRAAIRKENAPAPPEPPRPVPVPPPAPERKPEEKTLVAYAAAERVEGDVVLLRGEIRQPLKPGDMVAVGDRLDSLGKKSLAVLVFADQTRVELGPETRVGDLRSDGGKQLFVAKGYVRADVPRQPANQPMVLRTALGEATVLGTRLRFGGDDVATLLEVVEGKVRLKRTVDAQTVDVPAGHYAVAASGGELAALPIAQRGTVTGFTLINVDSGQPIAAFDPVKEGAVIVLSALPTRRLNLRANVVPSKVASVRFVLDGAEHHTELGATSAIYSLAGDSGGKYNAWTLAPGTHTVTATPYLERSGRMLPGAALTLTFRLVEK